MKRFNIAVIFTNLYKHFGAPHLDHFPGFLNTAQPMDPTTGIKVAPALPFAAPTATSVVGPRRSDGGVSLGLFSKIAAARKEKLAPVKDDSHSSMRGLLGAADAGGSSPAFEKRSASPQGALSVATGMSAVPTTSHFPVIHEPSGHLGRATSVSRAPPNPRKVTARNFAQNLRWTKHGFADDIKSSSSASTATAAAGGYYPGAVPRRSSPSISPVVRNMQPDRLQPSSSQQQQGQSVFGLVSTMVLPSFCCAATFVCDSRVNN